MLDNPIEFHFEFEQTLPFTYIFWFDIFVSLIFDPLSEKDKDK